MLGNLHYNNSNYQYASACYNNAINILSKYIVEYKHSNLYDIKRCYDKYLSSKNNTKDYDRAVIHYNNLPGFVKFFASYPTKPYNYNNYQNNMQDYKLYKDVMLLAEMYDKLANICKFEGENCPAKICKAAANDIQCCNHKGNKILELRSDGIRYLGDLYPELKEYK